MNPLLEKLNEYRTLSNFRMEYTLGDQTVIEILHKVAYFPHLLGLHKLLDIPIIGDFNDHTKPYINAKSINSIIKKETILTDSIIRNSRYFPKIEDRYEKFSRDNLLTVSYTDAIVDFDASLVGSALRAKYILFEKKDVGYDHFCVGQDNAGKFYAESFFYDTTDRYIKNQTIVPVARVRIYDENGALYLEDTL